MDLLLSQTEACKPNECSCLLHYDVSARFLCVKTLMANGPRWWAEPVLDSITSLICPFGFSTVSWINGPNGEGGVCSTTVHVLYVESGSCSIFTSCKNFPLILFAENTPAMGESDQMHL